MEKQKTAIYCRLSIEDENIALSRQESESIQNQKHLLSDYALKHQWDIYKIYCDEDYSGLDNSRPAFCDMLKDAQAQKFSIILCKTQSRLTRSMETAEKLLHYHFPMWGIRFVTVVDYVDTASRENKKARQINSLINEWYCEELSDNIRAVFRQKMESGQFLGNYAPYGYQKDPQNHHHLIIDPPAAQTIQLIFHLYIDGFSCRKIAQHLTQEKITTPWQLKLSRGQDTGRKNVQYPWKWSENTIRKILKNQVYIGNMVQGKETKISYKYPKVVETPHSQWIIAENTHESIITNDVFTEVQSKMKSNIRCKIKRI